MRRGINIFVPMVCVHKYQPLRSLRGNLFSKANPSKRSKLSLERTQHDEKFVALY